MRAPAEDRRCVPMMMGGGSLPEGWRVLMYTTEAEQPTEARIAHGFARMLPPAAFDGEIPSLPPLTRQCQAHICPAHELPDVRAGNDA